LRHSQLSASQAERQAQRRRSAEAAEALTRFATVKQDERGTVITLAGESMFNAGETELLPMAQARLREVARVLTEQDPGSSLLIEGHTDTRGSEAYNTNLSQQRADAVSDYLVRHGVAANRIRSEGRGPREPVADNRTFDGRAANRRLELVLAPSMDSVKHKQTGSETATARVEE
jgi:outer membrane protein OmpA-like peptidoglycan-associated protein